MLIRNLILGLVIGLPLAAVAVDNRSEQSITQSFNSSMPASVQPDQPIQANPGAVQPSSDNRDAMINDSQDALKAQLKISGGVQEIAWNDFIAAVNERVELRKKSMLQLKQDSTNNKLTIVDLMQKRVDFDKLHYDLLVKQQLALKDLYASLNDEQQTNANTLLKDIVLDRRTGHHRPGSSNESGASIFK